MSPDEIKDPESLLRWIRTYEKSIYVRNKGPDGRYGTFALSLVSPEAWAHFVWAWLNEGRVPSRVIGEGED